MDRETGGISPSLHWQGKIWGVNAESQTGSMLGMSVLKIMTDSEVMRPCRDSRQPWMVETISSGAALLMQSTLTRSRQI